MKRPKRKPIENQPLLFDLEEYTTGTTEEILYDDKTYNMVFRLFNSVILKKQLNLELV